MRQIIKKIQKGKFLLWWDLHPTLKITVDFLPLIKQFQLSNNFVLAHWQARPKGLRRWGFYDGFSDNYYGVDYDKIEVEALCDSTRFLQMDEIKLNHPPSAVILFNNSRIDYLGSNKFWIKRNN